MNSCKLFSLSCSAILIFFPREKEDNSGMKIIVWLTILVSLLCAGCATTTYDDGMPREHSDMPWNTPAGWEGSIGVPGFSDYR